MHIVFPILAALLCSIVYFWATASIPWCGKHRRATGGVLASVVVLEIVLRRIDLKWHVGGGLQAVFETILMTFVLTALPIGLVRVVSALYARLRPLPPAPKEAPEVMTRRQMVEAGTGIALLGATGSMLGWGMARGRHAFEVDELPVKIVGLPRALDGYVIAQISDIHTGEHVDERQLDEGLDRVREAKADLLVVTGDLVDVDSRYAPLIARKLAAMAPRDGIFACLGNHDYYAGAGKVTEALRAVGIRMLVNDGLLIRPGDGGGFALLGVDDVWSYRYHGQGAVLANALAKVPREVPRILLSHQPPSIEHWAGQVALQLSGHTHGGQINPLGLRPADIFFEYVSGRYEVNGTTLYVNRGFGTVGPPARVNAPPEVTRIVLVAA
jgi:predicted MPP superfamily phosphohydrolase